MKMMYQTKHNNKNLFGGNFLKILGIFLIIIFFIFLIGISNSVRSIMSDAFSPLLKIGNSFYGGLNQIPKFFYDKNKLIKENNDLWSEIENMNVNIADYESIKYENQKLREDLKIKPIGNFVTSSIIAKPPQIPLDSLFLDRGIVDEIDKNYLVLAGERVLIGKIVEVYNNKSTAALNSFAGMITYGFVSRTDEPLEITGAGGGSIEARVPIDFDIVVGDKIMTGGSLYYLVAIVGLVEKDESSGFKNVLMSLPIDISKINTVFIRSYTND